MAQYGYEKLHPNVQLGLLLKAMGYKGKIDLTVPKKIDPKPVTE